MKPEVCELTGRTIEAIRSGDWSEELLVHVAACKSCRLVRWMGKLAAAADSGAPSPSEARLIWLKAGIRRRSRTAGRAMLPLRAGQWFGAAGLGLLLARFSPSLGELWIQLGALAPRLPETLAPLAESQDALSLIPAGLLLLLLLAFTASEA